MTRQCDHCFKRKTADRFTEDQRICLDCEPNGPVPRSMGLKPNGFVKCLQCGYYSPPETDCQSCERALAEYRQGESKNTRRNRVRKAKRKLKMRSE